MRALQAVMERWRSKCDLRQMSDLIRFRFTCCSVVEEFASNTISSRVYMGSDQLYREAVEAGVHEEEWELFLRERIERKVQPTAVICTF